MYIIFTDLDNTLLDKEYSYREAKEVLRELKEAKIPIIFCSAKTRREQEKIREEMGIYHPFIVEDGSAIYIPRGYFKETKGQPINDYEVIILGTKLENIIKEIQNLQKKGYKIIGYQDMTPEEIAQVTGLSIHEAKLAKDREFSETIIEYDNRGLEKLKRKFNVEIGGRFIHVFGKGADKGKAIKILTRFYKEEHEKIKTIGLGDSYTDKPLLKAVDTPILVKGYNGKWAELDVKNLYHAKGAGPKGWAEAIKKFVLKGGIK
ncbi:MAG: mannosyl-3-phosphoglycerate phosphatase [Methanothermobacter tenebrarum]|nr:mannosyl-3-phosphoglycerate phosphatase [Methanothermobacter sp.]HOQ19568.1 mannosyl-3-phosphoglycerate phosphatase [Methanothermobacter sp.]